MDSLIALKGKDFVIIASDTLNAYSVLRMKVLLPPPRTSMTKSGISTARN
jgi:20S proteasome alpha/beta subunit